MVLEGLLSFCLVVGLWLDSPFLAGFPGGHGMGGLWCLCFLDVLGGLWASLGVALWGLFQGTDFVLFT